MEYFTLAEDLEEIRASKLKLRMVTFVSLGVILIFFLLRGLGIVTVEYNKVFLNSHHQINKLFTEYYSENSQEMGKVNNTSDNLKNEDRDFYWNVGFNTKNADYIQNEKSFLENLIREKFSKEKVLNDRFTNSSIFIEKIEVSGNYWLPIIKNGKSIYKLSIENKFYDDTYSAQFSGEFDFEVYGICSINKLQKVTAEKIADIVVKSIKKDYKK
ncbi:MAG TPA: hypothetical protein PKY59_03755 [Pyrinomonadaceae bacterium]|nr:hypothetical protein [Pyrinomonadaceae bacterium]